MNTSSIESKIEYLSDIPESIQRGLLNLFGIQAMSRKNGSVGLKQRPIGMTQQKTLPTQSLARKITVLKKNLKKSGQDGGNWFVQRYHRNYPSD